MTTATTISFIGGGNMARSLIGGLIADGYSSDLMWVSNPSQEKQQALQAAFDVNIANSNIEACDVADVIILAVKPHIIQSVAREIADIVQTKKPLVISIASGIETKDIERWLGGNVAVVRSMPNTPAMLGCGATGLYATEQVSESQKSLAESILRAVGLVVWMEQEAELNVLTALSGSGPAYFFLIMEVMQQAAEKLGMDSETAKLLTLQTALGASKMALESEHTPEELRKHVTSPHGVTESVIASLSEAGIDEIFTKAITAGKERSEELAEELGQDNV